MKDNGGRRRARRKMSGPDKKSLDACEHWYSFLEDECRRDDGLLCFYDVTKSEEVSYLCGLLAECLTSSPDESGDGEDFARKLSSVGTISEPGEKFLPPFQSLRKA